MAVKITTKKGKEVTLLNPAERGRKFADELKNGVKLTNDNHVKMDDFGPVRLTETEASFRAGYLQARKDSAKAFKAKKNKK